MKLSTVGSVSLAIGLLLSFLVSAAAAGGGTDEQKLGPNQHAGAKLSDVIAATSNAAEASNGEAVYQARCAACHDTATGRAPLPAALKQFAPERIVQALINGEMELQGWTLSAAEIRAVALYLTGKPFGGDAMPKTAYCTNADAKFDEPFAGHTWNGWGTGPTNHRAETAEMAGLTPDQVPKLKLKWAFAIPGVIRSYGQPVIVGGRVFIGTAADKVYSLDAKTGCIYWEFNADTAVRSAITIAKQGNRWMAYFGDLRSNLYSVDAATGKAVWKTKMDDFPLAMISNSITLANGRLFVGVSSAEEPNQIIPTYQCCKFRGSVSAVDAATGKRLWKTYTIAEEARLQGKEAKGGDIWGPAGGGVWGAPTVDPAKHVVYIGTGNQYSGLPVDTTDSEMALDTDTGKILWVSQMTKNDVIRQVCPNYPTDCKRTPSPDVDVSSASAMVTLPNGKRELVFGDKSATIHALDPNNGRVLWDAHIGRGGDAGGIQFGVAVDDRNVYAPVSDFRRIPAKEGDPDAQPTVVGTYTKIDPKAGGGLFAVDMTTGKQVWYAPPPGCGERTDCSPSQSAAPTLIPGIVFSGSLDGHLRAYSTEDGKIVWDTNTIQEYQTINGIKGKGGSIDGAGPTVIDGILYVNSGYGFVGGLPGNVLLAYSVDGK